MRDRELKAHEGGIVLEERGAWTRRRIEIPAEEIVGVSAGTVDRQIEAARDLYGAKEELSPRPASPRGPRHAPLWLRAVKRLAVSEGLIVTTRDRRRFFGAGLSDDELRYLQAEIVRVLRRND